MKRGVYVLLLLAMLICTSSTALAEGETENLLEDEFFDEWNGDENNELTVWSNEHADREDKTVLKGNYSAGRDAGDHEYYYHPTVDIEKGVDYHMEVWVYAENGTESVETGIHLSEEFGSMERINDSGNMKVEPKEEWINHTWSWQATEENISFAVRNHGDFKDSYMFIGAAWLGTEEPPEDWVEVDDEEDDDDGGNGDDGDEEDETEEERLEVNSASQEELEEIVHIGPAIAESIVEDCDDFYSLAQLVHVQGLAEETVSDIIEEGKAYVLPPGENWGLSENPCSEEEEEEEEDCEEVVREVTVVEEETVYKEKEFEMIDHDEKVEQGSNISSEVLFRNNENSSENYTVYSYAYEGRSPVTEGGWTSNERTVELEEGDKEVVRLENTLSKNVAPGIYDFKVRILDEKDLDSEIEVVERNVTSEEANVTEEEEEDNETVSNETETPTGEVYRRRGPLESIIDSLLSIF